MYQYSVYHSRKWINLRKQFKVFTTEGNRTKSHSPLQRKQRTKKQQIFLCFMRFKRR